MEPFNINTVLGFALAYLVAAIVRYAGRSRFWSGVRSRARDMLADPAMPEVADPEAAAQRALVEAQKHPLAEVARSITPNGSPNGKH